MNRIQQHQIITILGSGSWGIALAHYFANIGHRVILWCHRDEVRDEINAHHTNEQYAPGIVLPNSIEATTDLSYAVTITNYIFEVIPVIHLRDILNKIKHLGTLKQRWVITSKGIEQHTHLLPSQIFETVMGYTIPKCVLLGPTFAKEVIAGEPTAAILSGMYIDEISRLFSNHRFKVIQHPDRIGVEVCAALKNVFAITIGIAKEQGFKENAIAYLMTECLNDLLHLLAFYGGEPETVYSLAGIGDLLLTATGTLSRNLKLGHLLGSGKRLDEVDFHPEGLNTLEALSYLVESRVSIRVCRATYRFIFQHETEGFLSFLW